MLRLSGSLVGLLKQQMLVILCFVLLVKLLVFGWYILGKLLVDCSLLADGFLGCDRWLVRFLVPGGRGFLLSLVVALFLFWLISWSVGWLFVADGGWTPRGAEAGRGHTMAVFLRLPT